MDLLPSATPWTILAGFVVALGTTIVMGIRALMTGRLVPGSLHSEVRVDRDAYKAAAETALTANRELAGSVNQLIITVDKLVTSSYENQAVMRQMMAAIQAMAARDTT